MSTKLKLKRILRSILRDDVKVVAIFLLFLLSIFNVYILFMGWMTPYGLGFSTPAIDGPYRTIEVDTDGDLLPDVVENTPVGEPVYDRNGKVIGTGTGTDPNDMDSDNDGFTDAAENNWGSDPNKWLNPGYVWFIWLTAIASVIYYRYGEKDLLLEYNEFDEMQSSGVSGKSGQFAYGSSTIFSQRQMSDEEKKDVIMKDGRYQRMMGIVEPEDPKIERNYGKMFLSFAAFSLFALFIRFIILS